MLFKRIKDWATSISAFRSGDVIPVDGPNGTAKMTKDSLLQETAQSTLAGIKNLPDKNEGYLALNDANGTGKFEFSKIFKYDVVENGPSVFSNSGFVNNDGGTNPDADYRYTDYIDIGDALSIDACGVFNNKYGGGIAFYNSAKRHISSIYNTGGNTKVVDKADFPDGAAFIRITTSTALLSSSFVNLKKLPKDITDVTDSLAIFIEELEAKSEVAVKYDVVENGPSVFSNSGFVNNDGGLNPDASYRHTDYIDIGDALSIDACGVFNNKYGGGIAFYNSSKRHISSIYNTGGNTKVVDKADFPDGAAFIRVTTSTALLSSSFVNLKKLPSDIVEYVDSSSPRGEVFKNSLNARSNSMVDGDVLTVNNIPSVQNNNVLHFFACITAFDAVEIYIGSYNGMWESGKIKITASSVYLYKWNDSTYELIAQHGLTFSEFIQADIITVTPNRKSTLIIKSSGSQHFECELNPWRGYGSNFTVTSVGSVLSKVFMAYSGKCFSYIDTAIFSDSYSEGISQNLEGCSNFAIDGYAGRGSVAAVGSFEKMLVLGKPKFVAWVMGMNDGDSSESINEGYKNAFDGMRTLCQSNGILFVPFTIPNVPGRIHYFKNLYIKNSGLFYVDMASALGADEIGSSWFSGMLSQDNVHPTAQGYNFIAGLIKANFAGISSDHSVEGE